MTEPERCEFCTKVFTKIEIETTIIEKNGKFYCSTECLFNDSYINAINKLSNEISNMGIRICSINKRWND